MYMYADQSRRCTTVGDQYISIDNLNHDVQTGLFVGAQDAGFPH